MCYIHSILQITKLYSYSMTPILYTQPTMHAYICEEYKGNTQICFSRLSLDGQIMGKFYLFLMFLHTIQNFFHEHLLSNALQLEPRMMLHGGPVHWAGLPHLCNAAYGLSLRASLKLKRHLGYRHAF